ncbi:MAG: glucose-6-phosphate dehydrogenase, partial [Parachlamydiales bacterium]
MNELSTHPLEEPGVSSRFIDPCIIVIFGATGDLTARKLLPALYNLAKDGQLPAQFACVGFARREKTHDQFRSEMKDAIKNFSRSKPIDESLWNNFKEHLFYHVSEFHDEQGYQRLCGFLQELDARLGTKGNRVFYFSTQPSFFTLICENLHKVGLIYNAETVKDKWSRIIIEKPFGHDLK